MSDSLNTLDKRPPSEALAMTPQFPETGLLPFHPQQVADNGIAQCKVERQIAAETERAAAAVRKAEEEAAYQASLTPEDKRRLLEAEELEERKRQWVEQAKAAASKL